MVQISENIQLRPYNSFRVAVQARYFAELSSNDALIDFVRSGNFRDARTLVLNGGSNLLFSSDFEGLILKIATTGIERIAEDQDHVWVRAMAGENWDDFVCWCIRRNLGGLENLSLIPGNVGAAPIQNIGAYGVEQKDVFYELEAINLQTGETRIFNRDACRFGYRDSIFKQNKNERWIVMWVTYRLTKKHSFKISYGAIRSELEKMQAPALTIATIGQAVRNIRSRKLPDTAETGSAGSFFKNPVVTKYEYLALQQRHPELVAYEADENHMKLAAGWLIDQLGWKGYREGDAGVWPQQALVLVNYGNASGADILNLAEKITNSVFEKFGIMLEPEVNII